MSFFFTKAKAQPTPAVTAKPTQANRSSKDSLNRLGCKACPLDNVKNCTPKMPPVLGGSPVYFLGDVPDDTDDKKGQPFTGKAGKLLKSVLATNTNYSFDNVVRDYSSPFAGRPSPQWVAMECCRSLVTKSIEQAKPKMVVGLGILPLQWMLNSSDMIGLRGRVFAVQIGAHKCWFMPTYHPQHIIDTAFDDSQPLRSKLGHCLKFDVARAVSLADTLPTPEIDTPQGARAAIQAFDGHNRTQLPQVLKLISEARKAPEKAIDIETSHLRPYAAGAKVLTVAISYEDVNFSFAMDHPKAGWDPDAKGEILRALRGLLSDQTKIIAHNAPFECEWFIHLLGKDVIFHDVWECTMMQAHFIDERRGKRGGNDDQYQPNPYQALDFLVRQHFGLAYKALFKLDRKNMPAADLTETLIYNAADTKYTLRLFHLQRDRLKQDNLLHAYSEAVSRQPAVALMQSMGIVIDQAQNRKIQIKLGGEIETIKNKIEAYNEVQSFVRDRKSFNIASGPDVLKLLKGYIKAGPVTNAEGKESVDKGVLEGIKHPIGKDIEEFRNRSKIKSTYVDPFELGKGEFIFPDGRIHPSFNTTFAETGRTSCTAHWTSILTQRGEIPIRDVVVGDMVWTHKARWRPVTALWRKGWEVMLNLKLSNGSVLTCTKNHRLLNSKNQWVTAGEIHGLFQKMDWKRSQSRGGDKVVSQQGNVFSEGNSQETGNNGIQCLVGNPELYAGCRIQNTETATVFNVQNGHQKSNDWADRRKVSPLERALRRSQRLPNHLTQWKEDTLSSFCSNEEAWIDENTGRYGSSSHRHRSTQQRVRQSSLDNLNWAQGYPLAATSRFKITSIEEIEIGRSCEVFDITVSDDASYLTCGVVSHNSDEPNQQNWPKRNDEWVRKQIVAEKGHVLVAFDYGQLEACTAAMCTKDKVLVKALWEDYDIHLEWAGKAARRYPEAIGGIENITDKAVMKKFRSIVKNKMVFPAMFGASNSSVAGYLNMPIEPVNKLMDEFWQTFYGLHNWQKRVMNDYYDSGFVSSPTGRRRHYPLTKNQAVNYPIQSLGCDIVCRAMVDLSIHAAATGKWYLHPIMNIHDDLSFSIPNEPDILEEAIETIYRVMLAPSYSFINVPLSVTCSVGSNWLEMDEIQKFWSHKDL